jgi:hypothetical protein
MPTNIKKYKIVGNFGPVGTKVIDQETGQEISQVKSVYWKHEVGEAPRCFIELVGVELESEAVLVDATDMDCGPWRKWLPARILSLAKGKD